MYRRKRRILKSLVLSFAVAAFAAPAALGEPRGPGNTDTVIVSQSPDDRSVYRGTSVGNELDPLIADAIRASQDDAVSPDDRALFRGVESPNVPVTVTVSSPSDGFQWSDAGLGAVSTMAFVLLLGAATLLIRHQRRRLVAF